MDKQKKGVMVTVMIFAAIAVGIFVSTIVFYG
jgi:hypothetical protein